MRGLIIFTHVGPESSTHVISRIGNPVVERWDSCLDSKTLWINHYYNNGIIIHTS